MTDKGATIERAVLDCLWEEAETGCAVVNEAGNFVAVNRRFCDLLEYSTIELRGMKFQDITHPSDALAHATLIDEVVRGNERTLTMVVTFLKKTGYPILVKMVAHAIPTEDGKFKYLLSQLVPRVSVHSMRSAESAGIRIDSGLVVVNFLKENKALLAALTALLGGAAAVLSSLAQALLTR